MVFPFSKRDLDGMTPSVAHPDGKDLAEALTARLNDVVNTATVLSGQSSVAVTVGADYDGRPAFGMLMEADGTFLRVRSAVWDGSGNLTLTGEGNASADRTVSYFVAGTGTS